MQRPFVRFMCAALLAIVTPLAAMAADDSKTYTNPKEAGPDYALQGEYVGKVKADAENDVVRQCHNYAWSHRTGNTPNPVSCRRESSRTGIPNVVQVARRGKPLRPSLARTMGT